MLKTVSSFSSTALTGALVYQGTWNASTNNPTLTSSVGTKGDYYVVSVAGSTNLDGTTLWGIGDWAVFNGAIWQKVDGGDSGNFVNISVSALTGYMYANGTSNVSASTTIPNSGLANSTITLGNTTLTLGGTTSNVGNLTVANVTILGGTTNAAVFNFTGNTTATATYGDASLPLQPAGFMQVNLNGTVVKVPYYAV
jgi:hypothetical protein